MMRQILWSVGAASAVVVLTAAAYLAASRGVTALERWRRVPPPVAFALRRILLWAAVAVAVLLALQALHVIDNAWAAVASGFALLGVAFVAVWSILSNMLCAMMLMIARPFDIGDTIELPTDNLKGKAVNFSLLFTTLRADDGGLIQIPNNLLFQKPLKRLPGEQAVTLDEQLLKEANTE